MLFLLIVTHITFFSTHSCRVNVKMAKLKKTLNKIWWSILMNSKLTIEIYSVLKGKIYHQYHDTYDMEWPKNIIALEDLG